LKGAGTVLIPFLEVCGLPDFYRYMDRYDTTPVTVSFSRQPN